MTRRQTDKWPLCICITVLHFDTHTDTQREHETKDTQQVTTITESRLLLEIYIQPHHEIHTFRVKAKDAALTGVSCNVTG